MSEATPSFDFRSAIEKQIARFEAAANTKDAATIAGMYMDDATLMPPGSPAIQGRANIQTFWKSFFDAGASDAKLRVVKIESTGDMAYEIGAYEANLPGPGGIARGVGKYIVIWKRQADGSIRMAADIFNADA
jgi:uncharacterized protein (TIGR02246 family)